MEGERVRAKQRVSEQERGERVSKRESMGESERVRERLWERERE